MSTKIFEIIKDYQLDYQDRKHPMSANHIQVWANQFGVNAEFILTELLHILPQVYVSKEKAIFILRNKLLTLQKHYKYKSMSDFIANSHFLNLQSEKKSQSELLEIIFDVLEKEHFVSYSDFESNPKKHFIYFDDILATGGTIVRDIKKWLESDNNKTDILNGLKTLAIPLFCYHQLGLDNTVYRLMKFSDDRIKKLIYFDADYVIENNIKTRFLADKQKLNCAYPMETNNKYFNNYLNNLDIDNTYVPAYRSTNQPKEERFFSSPENRIKFENILLQKGIDLLNKIQSENPDPRKRPLGDTMKSHRTFGTGTLFFTWRNISNTCPLIFWWDVASHNWTPLFHVKNRGV